jgi:hypothetical protein
MTSEQNQKEGKSGREKNETSTHREFQGRSLRIGCHERSLRDSCSENALPMGLQIVVSHNDDFGVLQMAYAFEQVTNIGKRRPVVV